MKRQRAMTILRLTFRAKKGQERNANIIFELIM